MPGSHRTPERRLSPRTKIVAAAATAITVVGGTLGYFAVFPKQAPEFVKSAMETVGFDLAEGTEPTPPMPTCPLTGEAARGGVPARPALAVKVENAPESRPQASLNDADIVVEQPVEGGYTRFIAIFQCGESDRVGPVRSSRMTDPDYLRQLGHPVFAYAGGVAPVTREVGEAELDDVNYFLASEAYARDSSRSAPHNLFTITRALWELGKSRQAPDPVFTHSATWGGRSRRARFVHLPFSSVSDVWWRWSRREGSWLRAHGEDPHLLEDGATVSATNVVIQVVEVTDSQIIDAAGNPSPDVRLTGSGRAFVLRDGRLIAGRWERESLDDLTRFVSKDGSEIALSPGRTWVELVPTNVPIAFEGLST